VENPELKTPSPPSLTVGVHPNVRLVSGPTETKGVLDLQSRLSSRLSSESSLGPSPVPGLNGASDSCRSWNPRRDRAFPVRSRRF